MYSGYTVVFDKRQDIRDVARRKPGSTDFNIFSSELNVNGYPFKRSKSLLNKGQPLKGKKCSYKGSTLSFKSRPYLRKASLSRETNRKSQKLFPLFKMAEEG